MIIEMSVLVSLVSTLCPVSVAGWRNCSPRLPTEHVTFDQIADSQQTQQVEQLGAMVHAVREDVGNRAAIRLLLGRVVERVHPQFVEPSLARDSRGDCCQ